MLSMKTELRRGVVIELDFTALPGQKLLLDCCTRRLAKEGLSLDAITAARFLQGQPFTQGVNALCGHQKKTTVDVPTVVSECQEEFSAAVTGALNTISAPFLEFLSALVKQPDCNVILLSCAEMDKLTEVFASVAAPNLQLVHETGVNYGCTTWEALRRLCRKEDLYERLTAFIAGSGYSTKAAITTGMGVVAKPCEITEYQDFTGSDVRIEEFSTALVDDVLRILRM